MSDSSLAAEQMFLEGYNCAQSVLAGCGRQYGLPKETAVKVAQAFGGGIGRTGGICGAVTGALMVIGLKRSAASGADQKAKQDAYRLTREFLAQFQARNKSVVCRDLLGCDISTEEGFRKVQETGLHKTVCTKLVKDAVEIVESLLNAKE